MGFSDSIIICLNSIIGLCNTYILYIRTVYLNLYAVTYQHGVGFDVPYK